MRFVKWRGVGLAFALMAAFVAQLRVLLGLPGMPLDSALSASSCGFAAWEVDLLARRAASAHGRGAQQSLASLGTIVGGLPNMVVSDTIADLCRRALNALADSRTAGAQGEHKIARGYLPASVFSAHYIADPALREPVARYLDRERDAVEREMDYLTEE